jgi:transcriptional regulator with XRE-family HTH domain
MTNIRQLLAHNIKAYRNEQGLTQARLAELAGTATHYIAMIEGCKNFPSPEMIERLAGALKKDSIDLFALTPMRISWKESILTEIESLIHKRILELATTPKYPGK